MPGTLLRRLRAGHPLRLKEERILGPETTVLASLVRSFAALLTPADGNAELLTAWIVEAQAVDLPRLYAFTCGLELDGDAVTAALTCWADVALRHQCM
ncbi:hypothetical protein [Kitasatospora sp. NPDC085879]|uniref:hypothetical protein n=1 Tax=Kitasatospora sp. NPDC085879 TaxID=3154769 RepID=UPI00343D0471